MRIDPVDVAGPLENVAFHSVHHVVLPGVLDKIVMGLGAGLLPRGHAISVGIPLMEPNWNLLLDYAASLPRGQRS